MEAISTEVPRLLESLSPDSRETLQGWVTHALSGSVGFLLQLLNLALLPIFAFYIVRDWDHATAWFHDKIPHRLRGTVVPLLAEIDERLSAFLRGQLTVCCVLAVLYSAGLWSVARIDLAVVVGVTSGLLFIVPYLGTAFGICAGTLLALLKFGIGVQVLYVWAVFGVVQLIEGWFLTPVVVGDKVGLHPLVVMVALLAGANLLGIWGMLFAIPVAATLSVLLTAGLAHYRKSGFFLG
jgi:predicted PurR-regulated permease PerM